MQSDQDIDGVRAGDDPTSVDFGDDENEEGDESAVVYNDSGRMGRAKANNDGDVNDDAEVKDSVSLVNMGIHVT